MNQKNLHYSSSGFRSWMTRLSVLIVMILIGTSSFAQQSNVVSATDNKSLEKAMDNPDVGIVLLTEGYYERLDMTVAPGEEVYYFKSGNDVQRSGGLMNRCWLSSANCRRYCSVRSL
ncbi:MAG: hypothetical protein U5L09_12685 [Bacteroidales bacterium]|nr:hypothetical protein [Bacteroidales bacterium]